MTVSLSEEVYRKIRKEDCRIKSKLNDLFNNLLNKRDQVAKNAGFENYRDYKFADLGRFDYTKEDCFQFHEAVKQHVLPLVILFMIEKDKSLDWISLRPWDTEAEPEGIKPLHPFKTGEELVEKTIECFTKNESILWRMSHEDERNGTAWIWIAAKEKHLVDIIVLCLKPALHLFL